MIFGRPLLLKIMPSLFEFGACSTTVLPVWVTFSGLPLELWNGRLLEKICSRIGVPLCTERLTNKKEKVSYARALMEIDIAKKLFTEIPIKLPNGVRKHRKAQGLNGDQQTAQKTVAESKKKERRMDATFSQKQGKQQHTKAGHDAGDSGDLGGDSGEADDPVTRDESKQEEKRRLDGPLQTQRKSPNSEFSVDSGSISGESGEDDDSGGQADDSGGTEEPSLSLGNLGDNNKHKEEQQKLVGKT
ncbi:hypothetical protein M9H77_30016 [Catharanthus roseus]|uniref:Uncharacterized protein n=1 Tax=Catharanthus roseus TaxID=4058 RepID=A0ACB9ZY15_CATRO|nr:hypothetical protein M9H77_30016 [Catharanthus roseus]